MAAIFVDMLGYLMVLPLLPYYAERMGASPFAVGVLVAAFAFAQVATAPLWGRISDRYGRRPVILSGLALSSMAYLLFGLAQTVMVLMVSRLVQGAGGGINGVIQAYVTDAVPDDRAKALGWVTAATSAGVMVGPLVGSLGTTISASAPGFIASGLCLLNVVVAFFLLPESTGEAEDEEGPRQSVAEAFLKIFRHPGQTAHVWIWVYSAGMMAFMAMNGVLALYLERVFGITESTIGYLYSYVGAVSLVMRAALLSPLINRFGELTVLRAGAVAVGVGLLLIPIPVSLWAAVGVLTLVPVGTAMLFPATTSQVSHHARPGHVGQTLGLQQSLGGIARMIGPVWAGAAFQHLGWGWPFWMAAALMGVATLLALFGARQGPPRTGRRRRSEAGDAPATPEAERFSGA